MENFTDALADCDAVLQKEPSNVKNSLRLARCHLHKGIFRTLLSLSLLFSLTLSSILIDLLAHAFLMRSGQFDLATSALERIAGTPEVC
jgi:hypothetical protein